MKGFISILMSFMLLLSSSGLTYAQHYCGEYKVMEKITLGKEHLSCGMKMEVSPCEDGDVEEHGCCENEYTDLDIDDNFAKASFELQINPNFILAFVPVFVFPFETSYKDFPDFFKDYSPPPLGNVDIQVRYQTFLI